MANLAPCGVICDLCLAFQRKKNKCVGCNSDGPKPYYCTVCSIKFCVEKKNDETQLCSNCRLFPCKRIKSLDKRYIQKYGENLIENLLTVKEVGLDIFLEKKLKTWICKECGLLLCVHRDNCLNCEGENPQFPKRSG